MPSVLRYSAVAAMIASVSAGKLRAEMHMPSQTVGAGMGLPIFEAMPTQAPSRELLRRKLEVRAETNTCSEWTIVEGAGGQGGQPVCSNSQTCIFSTVNDLRYEGCGRAKVSYDWITECYNYPRTGTAGASQVFCDSAAPSCGVFKFVFDSSVTFSNFGCGTDAYTFVATLIDKTGSAPNIEAKKTSTVSDRLTATTVPGETTPKATDTKSSTPIGAIVGGAVGGIAVIALIGVIVWYCLRKRKEDKEAAKTSADAATAVAYHNATQTAEMEGTSSTKPGFASAVGGSHFAPHKQGEDPNTMSPGASPPPVYGQPGQVAVTSEQFTELEGGHQQPNELGTGYGYSRPSELGVGVHRGPAPPADARRVEMGDSTGGINRPAVGRQMQQPGVDMSGAPMSGDYRPHEMP